MDSDRLECHHRIADHGLDSQVPHLSSYLWNQNKRPGIYVVRHFSAAATQRITTQSMATQSLTTQSVI
jgi:hypothetical protein